MALGPIPFTAIFDYFTLYDLSDFDEFSYVMRRMDKVYLELNNEEVAKANNRGNKSSVEHNRDKKNNNKS